MKKIIFYIVAIYIIAALYSCEDNQDLPALKGKWEYQSPYFAFDYAHDSITLEMNQGKKMSIAVTEVKGMFMGIASQKMGAYFKGIEFSTENQLYILAQTATGISMKLKASYLRSTELIQLTLDQEQMSKIMGPSATNIPPISLKYFVEGQQMTLYLDEVYMQVIYSMMEDDIIPMVIKKIVPGFDRMPEAIRQKMLTAFKTQFQGIFDNIIRLHAGFVLKASQQ